MGVVSGGVQCGVEVVHGYNCIKVHCMKMNRNEREKVQGDYCFKTCVPQVKTDLYYYHPQNQFVIA